MDKVHQVIEVVIEINLLEPKAFLPVRQPLVGKKDVVRFLRSADTMHLIAVLNEVSDKMSTRE